MTITEMLGQSGLLTLLGMCVVFSFLIILIVCMKLLQIVVHALKLDKGEVKQSAKKVSKAPAPATAAPAASNDIAIVAAIAAAIREKESV